MKTSIALIAIGVALSGSAAWAQYGMGRDRMVPYPPSYSPYPYYYEEAGSTIYGDSMRGLGNVIRSAGQLALDTSAAAVNLTEARRYAIENSKLWTQTYFEMRRLNREYRAAERGPRPSMEKLIRYAQIGRPPRLSPSDLDHVTGEIFWPVLLRTDRLATYRTEIEAVFSQRAVTRILGGEEYMRVVRLIDFVEGVLRDHIRELPPGEYVTARRFLEGLNYEASLPTG